MSDVTPRPTILDVAAAAGVARTTVSNALNGNGRVSEETRERIRAIANELGYRPNRLAAALRSSSTRTIAIVTPQTGAGRLSGPNAEFYLRFVGAVTDVAFEHGFLILLTPELATVEHARRLDIDGAIVADALQDTDRVSLLRQAGVPLVTYERDPFRDDQPAIVSDNRANMRLLLDHLAREGAQRIAVLAPGPDSGSAGLTECIATYVDWCLQEGHSTRISYSALGEESLTAEALLGLPDRPDAIIDFLHPATMNVAANIGLRVPEDIAISSYVDGYELERMVPAVTAIDLAPETLGKATFLALHGLLTGQRVEHKSIPGALRVRASTSTSLQSI